MTTGQIVSGGGITLSVDLWLATIDNVWTDDLSDDLVDGQIEMNVDRAVKLAASFSLRAPDLVIPYTDYLAPVMRFEYDDGRDTLEQQIGLFTTKVPAGRRTMDTADVEFEGDDLTSVMAQAASSDTVNIAAGTNIATAIGTIITAAGITRYNLPATTETLTTAVSFRPGVTRLEQANEVGDLLAWYDLGMDLDGKVSTPGAPRALASTEPFMTITDADLLAPVEVQAPNTQVANVVIVTNDDATAAPLTATATNSDASSPTSTVALGRSIVRSEKLTGSVTQGDLDAYAARLLQESRTYYQVIKITTWPNPDALMPHQTVDLDLTGELEGLSGLYWVRTAKMGFTPGGAALQLECNRITDNLLGVTI